MRPTKFFVHLFVSTLMAFTCAASMAFECSIAALEDGTVEQNGQAVPLPAQLRSCEGATVTGGSVVACAQDRRSRLTCRTLAKGTTITPDAILKSEAVGGWFLGFMDVLRGGAGSSVAVSRGATSLDLPTGPVLLLDDRMTIDFTAAGLGAIDAIEFHEGSTTGPVVATLSVGTGKASLDTKRLARGKTYWWTLRASGKDAGGGIGSFALQGNALLKEARAQQRDIARRTGRDKTAAAMMLAHWLWEQGLAFDAAQVLQAHELTATAAPD